MEKQTLHAAVITKDENNIMLSLKGADGHPISVYWPSRLTQDLEQGDEFFLTIDPDKPSAKKGRPSEEDLRNLLFELIN